MDTPDDLIEVFTLLDDWEERYAQLIALGRKLPPMDESLKTDDTLVRGCTSRVWMITEIQEKDGQKTLHITADSDAQIVKGLIALLLLAYQDKPLTEIPDINIEEIFEQLGLSQHLSPNRRNGFFAMVERVKQP